MLRAVSVSDVIDLKEVATCLYSSITLNLLGNDLLKLATVAIMCADLLIYKFVKKKSGDQGQKQLAENGWGNGDTASAPSLTSSTHAMSGSRYSFTHPVTAVLDR